MIHALNAEFAVQLVPLKQSGKPVVTSRLNHSAFQPRRKRARNPPNCPENKREELPFSSDLGGGGGIAEEMAGRREAPLMRGGGASGQPLSRGSRIAAAVAVGVTLGCVCAFIYPDGLIPRSPDSAIHWPRRVTYLSILPRLFVSLCGRGRETTYPISVVVYRGRRFTSVDLLIARSIIYDSCWTNATV
jgi:hypothetical protein